MTETERKQAWRRANPEKVREQKRRYRAKNKEKIKEYNKRKRQEKGLPVRPPVMTDEERRARRKESKRTFKRSEAGRAMKKRYYDKQKTKPEYKIKKSLRRRIEKALNGRMSTGTTISIGCTYEELKVHLEAQFVDGMSWDNYGEWHIDHIRPVCSFDLNSSEDLLKVNHYTNLRPLWAEDNSKKALEDAKLKFVTDQG